LAIASFVLAQSSATGDLDPGQLAVTRSLQATDESGAGDDETPTNALADEGKGNANFLHFIGRAGPRAGFLCSN
jgi:hypothetical protein